MDLWKWVYELTDKLDEQGHARMAELILRLPDDATGDAPERGDAAAAEVLAFAREIRHPWLEVYARHWHLQSRIFARKDARALPDAVALLEFAQRDDTRDCPQSVCAVQDLAASYGQVDYRGFSEERVAVASETLSRINGAWDCYACVASEYASALTDAGRPEEALALLARADAEILREQGENEARLEDDRWEALLALGRGEEALRLILAGEEAGADDAEQAIAWRMDRARALLLLDRVDEARAAVPTYDVIAAQPQNFAPWTRLQLDLVKRGRATNDWILGRNIAVMEARLEQQEVQRGTFDVAQIRAELAILRGARSVAEHAIGTMRRMAEKMRKPLDAFDRITRVQAALEALPPAQPLKDPDAESLLVRFRGAHSESPEAWVDVLAQGEVAWPETVELALAHAHALSALGRTADAAAVLEARVARGQIVPPIIAPLVHRLVDLRDEARLEALATRVEGSSLPHYAKWARGYYAFFANDYERAARLLREFNAAEPNAQGPRRVLAMIARRTGNFEEMRTLYEQIIALNPPGPAGSDEWDLLTACTMLRRWADVRRIANQLGFELEAGDAPVREMRELVLVRFPTADGAARPLVSVRTGPVSACVLEMLPPEDGEGHFDHEVVFDARPVGTLPDPIPSDYVFTHDYVGTIEARTSRQFVVEGPPPSDEWWSNLQRVLGTQHVAAQRAGTFEAKGVAYLRGLIGVRAGSDLRAAYALLMKEVASLPTPLWFPELAEAAGDRETALRHAEALREALEHPTPDADDE